MVKALASGQQVLVVAARIGRKAASTPWIAVAPKQSCRISLKLFGTSAPAC